MLAVAGVAFCVAFSGVCASEDSKTVIPRVSQLFEIDGSLDKEPWVSTPVKITKWFLVDKEKAEAPVTREVAFVYDEKYLYVAVKVKADPELLVTRDDQRELGDCIRFDFKKHAAATAGAATGFDFKGNLLEILQPYLIPITVRIQTTETGWQGKAAIPWHDIGGFPGAGNSIMIQVSGYDSEYGGISDTGLPAHHREGFRRYELGPAGGKK